MEHETRSKPAIAHQPRPVEHQGVDPRSLSAPCHASAAAACCSAASSTLRSSVTAVCDARYRRSLMDLHSQQRTRETHTRQHMGHGQRGVCACRKRQDSKCGCRHAHWRQSGARGAHSPITPRWLSGSDASGRGWGNACSSDALPDWCRSLTPAWPHVSAMPASRLRGMAWRRAASARSANADLTFSLPCVRSALPPRATTRDASRTLGR